MSRTVVDKIQLVECKEWFLTKKKQILSFKAHITNNIIIWKESLYNLNHSYKQQCYHSLISNSAQSQQQKTHIAQSLSPSVAALWHCRRDDPTTKWFCSLNAPAINPYRNLRGPGMTTPSKVEGDYFFYYFRWKLVDM